jgi:hypothetical protein
MWWMRALGYIIRGGVVTLALFIVSWMLNFGLKPSLHALFAFYCAIILLRIGQVCGVIALVLAILVAWSRLFLQRHRWVELHRRNYARADWRICHRLVALGREIWKTGRVYV